jgi:DNA repair protein RadC
LYILENLGLNIYYICLPISGCRPYSRPSRKVIERALHNKASALIFVHNHPSGNCKPSKDDILITEILNQAAQVLEIKVHDHIIISRYGYFSFRERGLI